MPVLGITGSMASGKTTFCRLLQKEGAKILDLDKKTHYFYRKGSPLYNKIVCAFYGYDILNKDKSINRRKLAEAVFANKKNIKILERLTHPLLTAYLKQWVKRARNKEGVFAAEVPLLFEKKLEKYFDKTIAVVCSNSCQKHRLGKYKLGRNTLKVMLSLQLPMHEKARRADIVVNNSEMVRDLEKQAKIILRKIKGERL